MNIIILGGFLGSGKTTIVMQLARHLVHISKKDHPCGVVIVENEIGQIGVDDLLLRSNGYQVNELFSGCACCTMAGELRGNVLKLHKEFDPQWMIIEATGVACPGNIRQALEPFSEAPCVILTVIDCQRFLRMLRPAAALIEAQTEAADVIFLNKIDLVTPEHLKEVAAAVRTMNPSAGLCETDSTRAIAADIWSHIIDMFKEKGV